MTRANNIPAKHNHDTIDWSAAANLPIVRSVVVVTTKPEAPRPQVLRDTTDGIHPEHRIPFERN